jgi:hypothetical protein
MQMPLFIRLLAMLPLRWIILAIAALCLILMTYFLQAELRSEGVDVTCRLTPPETSFVVREASAKEITSRFAARLSRKKLITLTEHCFRSFDCFILQRATGTSFMRSQHPSTEATTNSRILLRTSDQRCPSCSICATVLNTNWMGLKSVTSR